MELSGAAIPPVPLEPVTRVGCVDLGDEAEAGPVHRVQRQLATQGFLTSDDVDGSFGPHTESAVKAFQTHHGIGATGVVDSTTWAALYPPIIQDASNPDAGAADEAQRHGLHAIAKMMANQGRGRYVLGAGGTNPNQSTPFTWVGAQYGSDCIGAVCWAYGTPRHDPRFPEYEGDINVDSALMDAGLMKGGSGRRRFFRPLSGPMYPGVIICYPSVWARDIWENPEAEGHKPGDMIRMGHVGLVVGWKGLGDPEKPNATPWDHQNASLVTVECCYAVPALRYGLNSHFLDGTSVKGVTKEEWGVHFLEYVGP